MTESSAEIERQLHEKILDTLRKVSKKQVVHEAMLKSMISKSVIPVKEPILRELEGMLKDSPDDTELAEIIERVISDFSLDA